MHFTLIRGLARDQFHWEDFPMKLQSAFPSSEAEFLDLPGNGEFQALSSPTHISEYREFLRHHSRFVRQEKPTIIIAVSLGAMIAQDWAFMHPHEVQALVMINTSLRPSPFYQRMNARGLLRMMDIIKTFDPIERERKILRLTTKLLGSRMDFLAQKWGKHAKKNATSVLNSMKQIVTAIEAERRISPPNVPCLVLSSAGDELVNPKCSDSIAIQWGLPHKVHYSAGHDLTLDDPDWVINQLRSFLFPNFREQSSQDLSPS